MDSDQIITRQNTTFIPCQHLYYSTNILITEKFRFVISERLTPPLENKIQCPGGKIEDNETPRDAAKRETLEETSLDLNKNRIKFINKFEYGPSPFGPFNEICKRYVYTFYTIISQTEFKQITNPEPEYSTDWRKMKYQVLCHIMNNKAIDSLREGILNLPYMLVDLFHKEIRYRDETIKYNGKAYQFMKEVEKRIFKLYYETDKHYLCYGFVANKNDFEDLIVSQTTEADNIFNLESISSFDEISEDYPITDIIVPEFRWKPFTAYLSIYHNPYQ